MIVDTIKLATPKVLVYFTEFTSTIGGSEYLVFTVIQELLKLGCDITLATRERCNAVEVLPQYGVDVDFSHVKTIVLPGVLCRFRRLNHLFDFVWMRRLRKLGPGFDVCISCANPVDFGRSGHHFIYMMTFDPDFRAWVHRSELSDIKRFWFDLHKIRGGISMWLAGVRKASEIIQDPRESIYSNSCFVKRCIEEYFHCTIKPAFYPPTIFEPIFGSAVRSGVAYIGRVCKEKRIMEMIQIVARARTLTGVDIRFRIAGFLGSDEYTNEIRRLAVCNKWISLEGAMVGRDKAVFLSECKVAIHGRRDEASGVSVTEYLKAGLVPVVPVVGGAQEIVGLESICYNTDEDASEILARLVSDDDFYSRCVAHCINRAREFSASAYLERQSALIKNIVYHG